MRHLVGPLYPTQRAKGAKVLRHVTALLSAGCRVRVSRRRLLFWFGFQRRRKHTVWAIRRELYKASLRTHPEFTVNPDLDTMVEFRRAPYPSNRQPLS